MKDSINSIVLSLMTNWWKRTISFLGIVLLLFWALQYFLAPELTVFLSLLIASSVVSKLSPNRSFLSFGLRIDKNMPRDFILGLLWALVSMTIIGLIGLIFSNHVTFFPLKDSVFFMKISLLIFVISTGEELFFRGIIFQALIQRFSPYLVTLIVSLAFSLLHLFNGNSNIISFSNTFLASILFSLAYLQTKSLWLPISLHFFWNFFQDILLGSPVSGFDFDIAILKLSSFSNPSILLGGEYGIEGGVLATAILLISVFVFLRWLKFNYTRFHSNSKIS